MQTKEFIEAANALSKAGDPFIFLIDFEMQQPKLWLPEEVNPDDMLFSINGFSNAPASLESHEEITLQIFPGQESEYRNKYNVTMHHLRYGNSFLTNLTMRTKVKINTSLQRLFYQAHAPYRCWSRNQFLFFSPECFIRISNGKIYTFPMKGTINADIQNAASVILNNEKEMAEHVTIVDLLRNDLSRVADCVEVSRFRYLDEIRTNRNEILQVSSEISGNILPTFKGRMGSLLMELLPAGSVSGAPKDKTQEVIRLAEQEPRGYFTGIFGYFDGKNLDSCVNIRYLEQEGDLMFFRSGGGITTQSDWKNEYDEVIQKIYVPVA